MKNIIFTLSVALLLSACTTDTYIEEESFEPFIELNSTENFISTEPTIPIEKSSVSDTKTEIKKNSSHIETGTYMDILAKKIKQELKSKNVQVQQKENQIVLIFPNNVVFGTNQSTIEPQFEPTLAAVAKLIKDYDKMKVQVIGYTDNVGSVLTNKNMSLRKANAVANFLRLNGVDINRIVVDGLGPQNPIAPNNVIQSRQKNHRVELTLINIQ